MKFKPPHSSLPLPGLPGSAPAKPVQQFLNRAQRRAAANTPDPAAQLQNFVDIFNAGLEAHRQRNFAEAEANYLKALKINPTDSMLLNNYGVCLYDLGRTKEAVAIHRRAIAIDPGRPMAYNNLGVELNSLELHAEAIHAFTKAIAIEPNNPRAINNLGDSLVKLGKFEEGAEKLRASIVLDPQYVDPHSNLGMALWGLGRLEDAVQSFHNALALDPNHAAVRKNLGLVLLLTGDYARAWDEYEWRWEADNLPSRSKKPRWQGQDLGDKMIVVWCEQGVGDEVLHTSMLKDLVDRGMRVIWETDPRLVPLVQRSFPKVTILPRIPKPFFDASDEIVASSPSASLGKYVRGDISQFPKDPGGYLVADKERAAALRASLKLQPGEKLVGLSWVSKNPTIGANKTIPLHEWADILRTPNVRFVDLQYGDTSQERAETAKKLGIKVEHIDDLNLTKDLDGLAALISACDLVLTVSNSTAHLAGALGVPVWVLLPAKLGKFWYWGHEGEKSLWYASATIIRQKYTDDWGPSLRATGERLKAHFAAES